MQHLPHQPEGQASMQPLSHQREGQASMQPLPHLCPCLCRPSLVRQGLPRGLADRQHVVRCAATDPPMAARRKAGAGSAVKHLKDDRQRADTQKAGGHPVDSQKVDSQPLKVEDVEEDTLFGTCFGVSSVVPGRAVAKPIGALMNTKTTFWV